MRGGWWMVDGRRWAVGSGRLASLLWWSLVGVGAGCRREAWLGESSAWMHPMAIIAPLSLPLSLSPSRIRPMTSYPHTRCCAGDLRAPVGHRGDVRTACSRVVAVVLGVGGWALCRGHEWGSDVGQPGHRLIGPALVGCWGAGRLGVVLASGGGAGVPVGLACCALSG
jgi:hypothetical protein